MRRCGLRWVLALVFACTLTACGDDDGEASPASGSGGRVANSSGGTKSGAKAGVRSKDAGGGKSTPSGTKSSAKDMSAGDDRDAGGSMSAGGNAEDADGGPGLPAACAPENCHWDIDPNTTTQGLSVCCTERGQCGVAGVFDVCAPVGPDTGVDPSCPDYNDDVYGGRTAPGCCTPAGECGSAWGYLLGCVPNDALQLPSQACTYDATRICQNIIEVECDGPEDCGSGQTCCVATPYRRFACADSCDTQYAAFSEACHPGQSCTSVDAGFATACRTDPQLPPYLFLCESVADSLAVAAGSVAAGEVNCGDATCGSGEKCCVSLPGKSVCVPSAQRCTCIPASP
jgi:hypothetical protein